MKTSRQRLVSHLPIAAITLAVLAGCLGTSRPAAASTARDSGSLLAWTDATRVPALQLYQKTHPNVHLRIVPVPGGLIQKVLLFNRIGSGWPDLAFDAGPNEVATLSHAPWNYTVDLTPYVPKSVVDQFAPGPREQCRINGKLYCLRNDIAQNVLWYNAKLMKQFGYKVPATWEEYQQLGLRLGKEHPGYVIGSIGDTFAAYTYLWASGCPVDEPSGPDRVRINLADPTCTRVAALMDPLINNGTVTKIGVFDAAMAKLGTSDKILMLEEASWFGEYIFKPFYKTPKGELSVAPPLRWASEKVAWTGAEGGGAWFVSSHAANIKAAVDVITWICTNNLFQATAPTFPAYLPASDAWAKTISHDSFYAQNPFPVLKQAASLIKPTWGYTRYSVEDAFTSVVVAGVKNHKTVASLLPAFQSQLEKLAKISGYTIVH